MAKVGALYIAVEVLLVVVFWVHSIWAVMNAFLAPAWHFFDLFFSQLMKQMSSYYPSHSQLGIYKVSWRLPLTQL